MIVDDNGKYNFSKYKGADVMTIGNKKIVLYINLD